MLVIDDGSPDGTGELADRLAAELPFVDVLHRAQKEGLGPAYIAGFRRALADGAELVLEMDCDFSHDPADVPRLIAAAEDGADLVLGSRYVPRRLDPELGRSCGGRSRSAATSTRRSCSQSRLRDLTGGFKCFRRRVLETIDLDAIDSKGYAFQIETTYRVAAGRLPRGRGADRVHRPRARHSKMSRAIVLEAVWKVPLLRLRALDRPSVAWRPVRDVTDASFEQDVLQAEQAGRRRLLGAVVRPVHGRAPGARGARRRDREGRVREARHRRQPGRAPRATTCSRSRR